MGQIATVRTVADIIEEYELKKEKVRQEVEEFHAAEKKLMRECLIMGQFVTDVFSTKPYVHESTAQDALLKSAWKAIYNRLQIDLIAPVADKQTFDRIINSNPPELTFDNAKATFGDYIMRPRHHILRGLVEVFIKLDDYYKSHSKIKVGVKGLPKRIIINNFAGFTGSYGEGRMIDIVNAMRVYMGKPLAHKWEKQLIHHGAWRKRDFVLPRVGLSVKIFKNGNAHVHFNEKSLDTINSALAEWYGDALGNDAYAETEKPQSKAVSKDLQFYRTPKKAAQMLISAANLSDLDYVLEPSCGDGALLDLMRRNKALGYEFHAGRVAECRAKGHNVLQANFLLEDAKEMFDKVVMNPPFAGKHYQKHIEHALKFLKPGGTLVAILPSTARYDHDFMRGARYVSWQDLPVGSFSESGTNVGTTIFSVKKL